MSAAQDYIKPTLVLAIICLVVTLLLSATYEITLPIIEENAIRTAEEARKEVLPEADSFTLIEDSFDSITLPDGVAIVDAYQADNGVGCTVTVTSKGYSSDALKVMVGIKEDGTIEKIKILNNAETPGLGSKVSNPEFADQFSGMDNSMQNLQMVSGATISSKAMQRAVETAFQIFEMVKGV